MTPSTDRSLRLARVELEAVEEEDADDHRADGRDGNGPSSDEVRPAPPEAVLGIGRLDDPLRHHAQAVDPVPEQGQQRREQRDRRQDGHGRDEHAADPDRADERQRQEDHAQEADGDGRAGDDHRAARVPHRLDERGLDVLAVGELLAEAEDHQERVVERHPEPDERDQELDDDGHVRQVREPPDERERVEDRRHGDGERHRDGRDRPEDEEQDDERAEAADERLGDHARAVAAAARGALERVAAGQVDGHAGRHGRAQRRARLVLVVR